MTFDPELRDFPYRDLVSAEYRWSPTQARGGGADDGPVELRFTHVVPMTAKPLGGRTFFAYAGIRSERREQGEYDAAGGLTLEQYVREAAVIGAAELGVTFHLVNDIDDHGNVLVETTSTPAADLSFTVTRTFADDVSTWRLGRLDTAIECSTAGPETQCRTTSRTYDERGEIETEWTGVPGDPETHLTHWFYRDDFGNITAAAAADDFGHYRVTCTSYDAEGIFPYAHINPAGHRTYVQHHPGLGVRTALVDPHGRVTQWAHDGFGRVTAAHRPDQTSTLVTTTRTKDGGPGGDEWNIKVRVEEPGLRDDQVQLDTLGRPVRSWTYGPAVGGAPAPRLMQEITYDALGEHVARRSLPLPDPPPWNAIQLRDGFEYDGMGRITKHTTPWGAVTTYLYSAADVLVTGPGDVLTRIENDALGRPKRIVRPEGEEIAYTYGAFGGLRTATVNGETTRFQRDAYGRVRRQEDPDRGETVSSYDGFGQLTGTVDAAKREVTLSYDPLGRLVWRRDDDGITRWRWDTAPNGIGQLAWSESPDGHQMVHAYDGYGRPSGMTLEIDGESFTAGVGYDPDGRLERITYPTGPSGAAFAVRREYDGHGHLIALQDLATQHVYWQATAADISGRITGELFGNGAVTERLILGEKERVRRIHTTLPGGAQVQDLWYEYDDRLNLLTRTDATQAQVEHFRYDLLDRLTCAQLGPPTWQCFEPIEYAPNGNLLEKPGVGAYEYDPDHPHAVASAGGASFTYDAVGNQIRRPGASPRVAGEDRYVQHRLQRGPEPVASRAGLAVDALVPAASCSSSWAR